MGSSFPLTFIFFRGVGIPPTSSSMNDTERQAWKLANQTSTNFILWFSECRGSKAPARALSNSTSERDSYLFHSVPSFSQRFQLSEAQNFSIVQQLYISCNAIRIHPCWIPFQAIGPAIGPLEFHRCHGQHPAPDVRPTQQRPRGGVAEADGHSGSTAGGAARGAGGVAEGEAWLLWDQGKGGQGRDIFEDFLEV